MMPRRACTGIDCPIGLYERHDGEIRRLAHAINGVDRERDEPGRA